MYDCTRSRDAINHYLPKFPEYCPAYRSLLALFQTFQYPRPFGEAGGGRSSANSLSLFRTHRRPTAARKCESKCGRKKENALLFNPRNIASGGKANGQAFAQTIVLSFFLTFIIATLFPFPVEITYLLHQTSFRISFSPPFFTPMIRIYRRSNRRAVLYLPLAQFPPMFLCIFFPFSRKLVVPFCRPKH